MPDKFEAQEVNLLSMALAELEEGKLYSLMALINSEEKEMIGFIMGIQTLPFFSDKFKEFCKTLIPFLNAYGIGKLELTELTALGLKVGHKFKDEINEEETEE